MLGKIYSVLRAVLAAPENQEEFVNEITSVEQLDECLKRSSDRPLFLFKHSTRCPVSFGANTRVADFVAGKEAAEAELPDFYLVKVVESRAVSNAIQEKLGVAHQSPQLILVDKGRSVWNASHHNISPEAIEKALQSVPA